jgi:hypothetical protein
MTTIKTIAKLLIVIFLFQGCYVYQKQPSKLSQTVGQGPAKVINNIDKAYYFNEVILVNDRYYGIDGKDSLLLDSLQIKSAYLKDIEKSRKQTKIFAFTAGTLALVGIAFLLAFTVFCICPG